MIITTRHKLNEDPLPSGSKTGIEQAWKKKFPNMAIEQTATNRGKRLLDNDGQHSFISAAYNAFSYHKRLVISPDMIWITILQQLAIHIDQNKEKHRSKLVKFDGEQVIKVRRDGFIKGETNEWEGVFSEFTDKIKEFIGEVNYNNLILDFSTSTPTTKAAMEIALMDVVKSYFKFELWTRCGIPEYEILGNKGDWEKILEAIAELRKFNLDWWVDELQSFIKEFIYALDDRVTAKFWDNFFRELSMSGSRSVDGEINILFPYVKARRGETIIARKDLAEDVEFGQYLSGVSSVPFKWFYFEQEFDMIFSSGFVGFTEDKLALTPNVSWAVLDNTKKS